MVLIPDDSFWMRISELCLCILGSTLLCQLNNLLGLRGGPFLCRIAHLAYDGYTLIWSSLLLQYAMNESRSTVAEHIFLVVGCALHLVVALTAIIGSFANKCQDVQLLIMGVICMLVFALMLTELVLGLSKKMPNLSLSKKYENITNFLYKSENSV